MKCEICGNAVKTTFMEKVLGTYVQDEKGKRHLICFECQKNFNNDKSKILENFK